MKELFVFIIIGFSHSTFACSCYHIDDPCDYLSNEYSTPVLLEVNRTIGAQIAHVTVSDLLNDSQSNLQDYVILADSITSCGISIDHLKEGETYIFGLPLDDLDRDTIQYSQCMSPFYEFSKYPELARCSRSAPIIDIIIFPNPIQQERFFISQQIQNLSYLKVYDMSGQLVHREELDGSLVESFSIPKAINSGIYLLVLTTARGVTYHAKLMV